MESDIAALFRTPILAFEDDDEFSVYKVNVENEKYFMLADHYMTKSYEFVRKKALETMLYLYSLDIKSLEDEESVTIKSVAFAPYLGMNYFDRFMSKSGSEGLYSSTAEYYAMCCFFLGRGMTSEEFHAGIFDDQHKLNIDRDMMNKTQLDVVGALDFKLRAVTALSFIDYFVSLAEKEEDRRGVVIEVVLQAQSEFALLKFKPSLIAASVVLAVYEDLEVDWFSILTKGNFKKEEMESCLEITRKVYAKHGTLKGNDTFKLIWLDQDVNVARVPSCLRVTNVDIVHRSSEAILLKLQDVKLHRFNVETSMWQESTVSSLFFLKDGEKERVRLVVRSLVSSLVLANHWILPGFPVKPQVMSCSWEVMDHAFGKGREERFCAVFNSVEDCQKFVRLVKRL